MLSFRPPFSYGRAPSLCPSLHRGLSMNDAQLNDFILQFHIVVLRVGDRQI